MMDFYFRRKTSVIQLDCLRFSVLICLLMMLHEVTPANRDLKFNSNDLAESIIKNNRTYASNNSSSHQIYSCLPSCECNYDTSSLRLEIDCLSRNTLSTLASGIIDSSAIKKLAEGVRVLIFRNVVLNSKSIPQLIPSLPKNTCTELEFHHVKIDPISLFNSQLFHSSKNSLRRISIFNSKIETVLMVPIDDNREALEAFSSLKSLDSLTICDSDPNLSQIVLQALPLVNHVQIFNNSIPQIYYLSFSHLTSLQSLNMSHNNLEIIPNGLFDNLASLKSLDISHNRITHLQEDVFAGLTSLRKLNTSYNRIEYVDAEVFTNLEDLQTIDLSNNEVIQFFEPYFKHNTNLRVVKMSNTWVTKIFTNEYTAHRSYREMEGLISTLRDVEVLDLSDNEMTIIPETLSHVPRLSHVYLQGNPWACTCDDRWFVDWISTSNVSIGKRNNTENLYCFSKSAENLPLLPYLQTLREQCNNSNIIARTPFKYYARMGKDKVLNCHTRNPPWPKITWITPTNEHITTNANYTSVHQHDENQNLNHVIYPDGALVVHKVNAPDYGLYLCIASYDDLNITHYVHLGMDVSIFADVRLMSIIVGLITSFGFLILVLLGQAIRFLLLRSGLHCIAVRTANQARRVRTFFDSLEQNKNTQLDWLRQNYNMQAKKIQDNCISQLERIRESYTNQTKNLSEFREYSAQQLTTIGDQYQDQIRKVASYSAHRLGKVRENYVFNRNRVCKFSSHQLIRLREAYKWQAQTLNKILENLPQGLNLDACRGVGACGRADSVYLDDVSDFIGHSSNRSSLRLGHTNEIEDKHEHISLLIPPEFLASYLIPPNASGECMETTLMVHMNSSYKSNIREQMGEGDPFVQFEREKDRSDTVTKSIAGPSKSIKDTTEGA